MISRLPQVGTTIFTVISQAAQQHGAINLGQGFPDFPMSAGLVAAVANAMATGQNQYTHMNGFPPLREAIAQKIHRLYQCKVDADSEITVTPGGTYALFTALMVLLQPGDEAILFEPFYDCYLPQVQLAGGIPVVLPLRPTDFSIDWNLVEDHITPRTRVLLINSPHNPTGRVATAEDLQALRQVVARHPQLTILSDEVYEHLVFNGATHHSVLQYADLKERSVAVYSFGKTYHCTGWKLGYAVAPAAITHEFRKIHQFNAFTSFTPTQVALSQWLGREEEYLGIGRLLEQKQQYFQQLMAETPLQPLPVQGSYFQVYDYSAVSTLDDMAYAHQLIEEAGVAAIPLSAFYQNPPEGMRLLRFCFAKQEATLEAAAGRLVTYFK